MELTFEKHNLTTSGVANTALPISRDGADDPLTLRGALGVIYAPATNTADVTIGPDSDADYYPLKAGQFYTLPGTGSPNHCVDFSKWFCKSTNATQALKIVYVKIY